MASFKKTKVTIYSQEQMYALVNNVEDYKFFIPWCVQSEVLQRTPQEVRATLSFAGAGLKQSFGTVNLLHPYERIEIRLLHGPFRHLEGLWQFESLEGGQCRVRLDLEFEFSSKILTLTAGPLFHQVANTLVDVFCKRAEKLYG